MTKAELIEEVYRQCDQDVETKASARRVVDKVLDLVIDALARGDEVALPPLGKFVTVQRNARKGRNPHTGEELDIPARRAVKFKPSASLRGLVA